MLLEGTRRRRVHRADEARAPTESRPIPGEVQAPQQPLDHDRTTEQTNFGKEPTMSDSPVSLRGETPLSSPPSTAGDQRPHPDDEYQPRTVTAHAAKVDGTVVEQAHGAFTHAKASFEKFLNDIPREHFSADGLRAQIAKFADTGAA